MIYALLTVIALGLGGAFWQHRVGEEQGYKVGWSERDKQCVAQVSALESEIAESKRQAEALRTKAAIVSQRAAAEVAEAREQIQDTERRMRDALNRQASRHKLALRSELTRVLNSTTRNDIRVSGNSGPSSDAGSGANAQNAAAPRSGGGSSEHAVTAWMLACKSGYNVCRDRLHGLQQVVKAMVSSD